jgi:protein TonB
MVFQSTINTSNRTDSSGLSVRRSSMEATMVSPVPRFATRVGVRQRDGSWTWPVSIALHLLGAAAIVVLPLLAEEPLPAEASGATRAFFALPSLPMAPPPPPPPPAARAARAPRVAPASAVASTFLAPIEVPEGATPDSSLDLGIEGGVAGGVEGGVPGGVVGGVVGGLPDAPPPPAPVVRVGGLIREPKKVRDVPPLYPSIAREARIQGVVILEATITPQGRVQDVKVLRGVPALDEAAVEAVKQWTYTPTLVDGVPVGVVLTVTVNFILRAPGLT